MDRQMQEQLVRLWKKLHSRDLWTWIGHGVMGVGLGFLFGWVFVAGWFVGREVSDLFSWFFDSRPSWTGPIPYPEEGSSTFKRPFRDKAKDGFLDLWAPLAGAALAEIVKAL